MKIENIFEKEFLKSKAVFQIALLIFSVFAFSVAISSDVEAADVCCEKTLSGAFCVNTDASNCDPSFNQNNAPCEQTSFCDLGCCYDSSGGGCMNNVPKANCEDDPNGVYDYDASCGNVPACQMGCCELGNNYVFGTKKECENLVESFYPSLDADVAWNSGIADETSCVSQIGNGEEGCCVDVSYGCTWSTREVCTSAGQENVGTGGPGFYEQTYCSNPNLQCACAPQSYKACVSGLEDVYWFDSCGNIESVAEDCDYLGLSGTSTVCLEEGGSAFCDDIDCGVDDVVVDVGILAMNPQYAEIGVTGGMKHGESWCSYESGAGNYLDRPGSRHYRHICINGREMVQPCADFRQEVCIEGDVNVAGLNLHQANCVRNEIYYSQITEEISSVPQGQKFWTGENEDVCEDADIKCLVPWLKADASASWEITSNARCKTQDFIDDMALYCKSRGDCGADYNVYGDYTGEGVDIEVSGHRSDDFVDEISNSRLEGWSRYFSGGGLAWIGARISKLAVDSGEEGSGGDAFQIALVEGLLPAYVAILFESVVFHVVNKFVGESFGSWLLENAFGDNANSFMEPLGFLDEGTGELFSGSEGTAPGETSTTPEPGSLQETSNVAAGAVEEGVRNNLDLPATPEAVGALNDAANAAAASTVAGPLGTDSLGQTVYSNDFVGPLPEGSVFLSEYAPGSVGFDVTSGKYIYPDGVDLPPGAPGESMVVRESQVDIPTEETKINENSQDVAEGGKGDFSLISFVIAVYMLSEAETPLQYVQGTLMLAGAFYANILPVVGVVNALLGLIFGGSDTATTTVEITCEPWQAPVVDSADQCGRCTTDPRYDVNVYENPVECSEYRCKSLGRTCELVNVGTDGVMCVDIAPNDVTPPVMTPWNEKITSQSDNNGVAYSVQPLLGTGCALGGFYVQPKVSYDGIFTIGLETNEGGNCRWDVVHTNDYYEMTNDFDSDDGKHHYFDGSYPGGQDYTWYVRCVDYKDNGKDSCEYVAQFSTVDEPDLSSPVIEHTSILSGAVVPYGINQTVLSLYLNEQAESCRWSKQNVPFEQMNVSDSFICGCAGGVGGACSGAVTYDEQICNYVNNNGFYTYSNFECVGMLRDIQDAQLNTYYIACQDNMEADGSGCNVVGQNEPFEIYGTSELNIVGVEPVNGTYYTSQFLLRVVTTGGADNGNAICSFNGVEFFESGGNVHLQNQNASRGNYNYDIDCVDSAGNTAEASISITIDVDEDAPEIVNIFESAGMLHVITSEVSSCEYSVEEVISGAGQGTLMSGAGALNHAVTIDEDEYHIVCYDIYNNAGGAVTVFV